MRVSWKDLILKYSPNRWSYRIDDALLRLHITTERRLEEFEQEEVSRLVPFYRVEFSVFATEEQQDRDGN